MGAIIFLIGSLIAYYIIYVKLFKMNITHDTEDKVFNRYDVERFVEKNFKNGACKYDISTNTLYIYDNGIMNTPEFIKMLNTWKIYIQPSIF